MGASQRLRCSAPRTRGRLGQAGPGGHREALGLLLDTTDTDVLPAAVAYHLYARGRSSPSKDRASSKRNSMESARCEEQGLRTRWRTLFFRLRGVPTDYT